MCIYIYMFVYLYILFLFVYLYIYTDILRSICIYIYIYVYIFMRIFVIMYHHDPPLAAGVLHRGAHWLELPRWELQLSSTGLGLPTGRKQSGWNRFWKRRLFLENIDEYNVYLSLYIYIFKWLWLYSIYIVWYSV